MIRFSCNECGKSLRADSAIIGSKSKCTRCGAVVVVPRESTRSSGQKDARTPTPSSILGDSDPDLSLGVESPFSDDVFDSLGIAPRTSDSNFTTSDRQFNQSKSAPRRTQNQDDSPSPPLQFKRVAKRRNVSPLVLLAAAGILLLAGIAYLVPVRWGLFGSGQSTPTAFEQSTQGNAYFNAISDLQKAERALRFTTEGYLTRKQLPESSLSDLAELNRSLATELSDRAVVVEASEQYDAGNVSTANQLIATKIQTLQQLRQQVERKTEEYLQKTYH